MRCSGKVAPRSRGEEGGVRARRRGSSQCSSVKGPMRLNRRKDRDSRGVPMIGAELDRCGDL